MSACWSSVGRRVGRAFGLVALCFTLACAGHGPTAEPQAEEPLPPDGFLGTWHREGELAQFSATTLYNHIDGGAEVFLELGFDRLDVQNYTAGDAELGVEVYHMRDDAAALGIYLMKCGAETPGPGLAARHTVNRYQLQMWSGAVYLVVNRLAGEEVTPATMVEFARYVSAQLGESQPPTLFDALPAEGRIADSERVVRGPYTLEALYTFGQGDVFRLGEYQVTAVAADYQQADGTKMTRIRFPYPDSAAASAVFSGLQNALDQEFKGVTAGDDRLTFTDYAGRAGEVVMDGAVLEARIGLETAPAENHG